MDDFITGKLTRADKKLIRTLDRDELITARGEASEALGLAMLVDRRVARRLKEFLDFTQLLVSEALATQKPRTKRRQS